MTPRFEIHRMNTCSLYEDGVKKSMKILDLRDEMTYNEEEKEGDHVKKGVAIWNYHRGGDIHAENMGNARYFHDHGFDAVSWLGSEFDHMTEEQVQELTAWLKESGQTLTVHHILPDPDRVEACRYFEEALVRMENWQKRYGLITGLTFDFWYDRARMLPYLKKALDEFRGLGVFLACEDNPLDDAAMESFAPYITAEDDYGILIDLGHMNMRHTRWEKRSAQDFQAAFTGLPLKLREIHVSDNLGLKDDHSYLHFGTLPVTDIVSALQNIGFDGIVTIEIVNHNWTLEEHRSHAVETAQELCDALSAE